ncbi:unnamed protein product [Discula destructiva]
MDNLREWMGYDHNEAADCRGTKTQIQSRAQDMGMTVQFKGIFPEKDEMLEEKLRMGESVRELWTDVDERFHEALQMIWRDDHEKSIGIIANNRSIQSLLRLIGFPCGVKHLDADFGILNMQNAAVIPLLVTRSADQRAYEQWEKKCADFRLIEEAIIVQQRERDYDEGEEVARQLNADEAAKFALLLGPKELSEFEAHRSRS